MASSPTFDRPFTKKNTVCQSYRFPANLASLLVKTVLFISTTSGAESDVVKTVLRDTVSVEALVWREAASRSVT